MRDWCFLRTKWRSMKTAVINIGCKVNQCECDSLMTGLKALGHEVTDELVYADNYVINTCAVTKEAERKSRQYVGKVQRINPRAEIYIIGCASEKNAEQFAIKGVKYVSGTAKKDAVLQMISGVHIEPLPERYESLPQGTNFRARAYVKVEDGCNNFCSYCIIPYLRGRVRSRSLESIREECVKAAETTDEIVLTGINLSCYGTDLGISVCDLISALRDLPVRLRFGSLEVNVIDENFLHALIASDNICPHFHLSLQSGSDVVLESMNRHYTTDEYRMKVSLIRTYFPTAAITTDIIVGFPTETEERFEETLAFAREIGFANIHVFPYSRRFGTAAYPLGALPDAVLSDRVKRLSALRDELKKNYESSFVGCELEVVPETSDGVFAEGYSENYIRVYIPDRDYRAGKKITVTIEGERADGLLAR